MKYIKEYLNNKSKGFNVLEYSDNIINMIQSINVSNNDYIQLYKTEVNGTDKLDIIVFARFEPKPNVSLDSHFNHLPWEQLNINDYGYSIDANMTIGKNTIVPEIEIHIMLSDNPNYTELKFRLIDIIYHELKHVNQVGLNRKAVNVHPGSNSDRKEAKNPIDYFHLPEEIEAMVYGMYNRSKIEGSNLDELMFKYLTPYINNGNINIKDATKTVTTWMLHALENYPDSKLSNSKITSQIIKNL